MLNTFASVCGQSREGHHLALVKRPAVEEPHATFDVYMSMVPIFQAPATTKEGSLKPGVSHERKDSLVNVPHSLHNPPHRI